MATTRPDHLRTVHAEVLLGIMKEIPDLISLDNLIRASPRCFRLFNNYAVEITQAVLSAGYTHGHIRMMVCIIALIRSSTLPFSELVFFQNRVTDPAMKRVWEAEGRGEELLGFDTDESKRGKERENYARVGMPAYSFTPIELPNTTSPAILRSILASARQNTCLALECLEYYLLSFRSLRPMHLLDPDFTYLPKRGPPRPVPRGGRPWELKPPGDYCAVRDIGPPTWEEEQRAIRAFWRLRTFHDLRKAAAHSLLAWSDADIETLNSTGPIELLYGCPTWKLRGNGVHPELEELKSVLLYIRTVKGMDDQTWFRPDGQEVNRAGVFPEPREEDWGKLIYPSSPYLFFYFRASGSHYSNLLTTPLAHISFNPFRPLGFAFWSNERMAGYGLANDPHQQVGTYGTYVSKCFYPFAWQSILAADELAEVARRNELREISRSERAKQIRREVEEDYAV